MQSYGMTLMLKDDEDIVERYRRYHRDAWPEVIARLREVGIVEMPDQARAGPAHAPLREHNCAALEVSVDD